MQSKAGACTCISQLPNYDAQLPPSTSLRSPVEYLRAHLSLTHRHDPKHQAPNSLSSLTHDLLGRMPPLTRKPSTVNATAVIKQEPGDGLTQGPEPMSIFFKLPAELQKTVVEYVSDTISSDKVFANGLRSRENQTCEMSVASRRSFTLLCCRTSTEMLLFMSSGSSKIFTKCSLPPTRGCCTSGLFASKTRVRQCSTTSSTYPSSATC